MHPYLIQIGRFSLSTYGVLLAVAFLLVVTLSRYAQRSGPPGRWPLNSDALADWAVWIMIGGIVGARGLYVGLNWDAYLAQPFEIVALWHGGLIWYGGFIGGVAASLIFFARRRVRSLAALDQVIPFVALGHAIGRIGCFENGCCGGKPTTAWCGVWFPGQTQAVIPTQLIEAAGLLFLYMALRSMQERSAMSRRSGAVFGAYLIGYGLLRWMIEWWRDQQPIVWHGWTLPQVMSLGILLVGMILLANRMGRAQPSAKRS